MTKIKTETKGNVILICFLRDNRCMQPDNRPILVKCTFHRPWYWHFRNWRHRTINLPQHLSSMLIETLFKPVNQITSEQSNAKRITIELNILHSLIRTRTRFDYKTERKIAKRGIHYLYVMVEMFLGRRSCNYLLH